MGTRAAEIVRKIRIGDAITAEYLNAITRIINENSRAVHAPRQAKSGAGADAAGGLLNLDFTETSRTETTTPFTDDNGDVVNIDVVDTVTFTNETGEILTLVFDNT
jgi:hypothetical protein